MTAQVFSFLFFGVLSAILYFSYKHNDRKIVLIISGLLFLVPFTFGFLSFNHDNTMPLWLISIMSIIIIRFIKGKFKYFLIPVIIYFFILPITTRSVTIINDGNQPEHKSIFTSSLTFEYKNGEQVILPIEDGEIINNTPTTLYVESVHYSVGMEDSGNNNRVVKVLEPFSCSKLNYRIDFYFHQPPTSIQITRKQGEPMPEKETKYWLHN